MDREKTQPDIARAIERSRRVRAAIRRRRRRNVAIAVCLSVALAGAGTFGIGGLSANDMVHAAVTQAQNLAQLLDQRSPGARTQAQLTKTKHERALAKQRRARGSLAHRPDLPPVAVKDSLPGLVDLLAGPVPVATVDAVNPNPQLAMVSPPSLATIVTPPGSGTAPPGSGLSPPGGGGGVVTPTTPPHQIVPTSPLPEPGTWAMMLVGFALIGWRARHARGLESLTAQSSAV